MNKKIFITFEKGNINLVNLQFCYNYPNLVNIKNKNIRKYLIFTSESQSNLIIKCNEILIDGTFKCCPKTFYQVINFTGFYTDMNATFPLFLIPTKGKSEYLFDKIIKNIISIYEDTGHNKKDFPKYFIMDFEGAMQKTIKKIF